MFAIISTETTGLPDGFDENFCNIETSPRLVKLTVGLFSERTQKIELKFSDLIKPEGFNIPKESTSFHGVRNSFEIRNGNDLRKSLINFHWLINLADAIVGHNIEFHVSVIECELERLKLDSPLGNKFQICTMKETANYCQLGKPFNYKWPTFEQLYNKLFDEEYQKPHNSLLEIQAIAKCLKKLISLNLVIEPYQSSPKEEAVENYIKCVKLINGLISTFDNLQGQLKFDSEVLADIFSKIREIINLHKKILSYVYNESSFALTKVDFNPNSHAVFFQDELHICFGVLKTIEILGIQNDKVWNKLFNLTKKMKYDLLKSPPINQNGKIE
jgi:DNA polymerase-3 subunit epsilon